MFVCVCCLYEDGVNEKIQPILSTISSTAHHKTPSLIFLSPFCCKTPDIPIALLVVNYLSEDLARQNYNVYMPTLGLSSMFTNFSLFAFFSPASPNTTLAELSLLDIQTTIISRTRKAWWRRYTLVFECTWGPALDTRAGEPITSPLMLERLQVDLERSLRQMMDVMTVFELDRLSNGTVAMGADDPRVVPFRYQTFGNWTLEGDLGPVPLRETGTFTDRVRIRDWVRRMLGGKNDDLTIPFRYITGLAAFTGALAAAWYSDHGYVDYSCRRRSTA